jgi:hypothetical protein
MAIYRKGQRHAAPYSQDDPDFVPAGKNLENLPSTGGGARCMDVRSGDGFRLATDLSGTIDPQKPYATSFDQGGGDYQREKSAAGLGGATGPMPASSSHPKAGGINGKKTS